jgi:uncharacterized protein
MADPSLIHPDRLTEAGHVFEGVATPGDFPELDDRVASGEGEVRWRVEACVDARQRRVVSCIIEGFVFLECQSTQEVFRHEVASHDRLVLVGSESELPPFEVEDDQEDFVVATTPLDPLALVEESLLLALPMVPRKPGAGPGAPAPAAGEAKPSPFAALASLKSNR